MAYEYYLRTTSSEENDELWQALLVIFSASPVLVSLSSEGGEEVILLRASDSSGNWDYDIRIFHDAPILVEISSWNDGIRAEFNNAISRLRENFDLSLLDEDDEPFVG